MGTERSHVSKVLERFHSRQVTLWSELHENKVGWFASIALHAAVLIVAVFFVVSVVEVRKPRPGGWLSTESLEQFQPLRDERLKDLFEREVRAREHADEVRMPDISDKHDRARGPIDEEPGVHWLGPGRLPRGKGGGLDGPGDGPGTPVGPMGPVVRQGRQHGLDLVFVFDSTGSMSGVINETKTRIRNLVRVLDCLIPTEKIRIGVVTYRDSRKYDLDNWQYTVKARRLTNDLESVYTFLRRTEAYGGGDIPEAVYDGLRTAIGANNWRARAVRVIVVFGDAPPRPEDDGLERTYKLVADWHRRGGIISAIDTSGEGKLMPEFAEIARRGGGVSLFLENERGIAEGLFVSIFPPEARRRARMEWERLNSDDDADEGIIIDGKPDRPDRTPRVMPTPLRRPLQTVRRGVD